MLKDIPYSVLKKDRRAYEIMLLRDQYGYKFSDIAAKYGISYMSAREIYGRIRMKKIHLYIKHIATALGHENSAEIRKVFETANACYQDFSYVCAYLEKIYKNILDEYRRGEPGMPESFVESLPPLKTKLSKKTISRIVEMREVEKATFLEIGKKMCITPEKARHTYEMFYYQPVLDFAASLMKDMKSEEEKQAVWLHYFGKHMPAKKLYDMMIQEQQSQ